METQRMKRQLSIAYRYSFTRLTLNYFTYYESMAGLDFLPEVVRELNGRLNEILGTYFEGGLPVEETAALRNRVKHQMEIITAYADCCRIYEHALNRIERRFMPEERRDRNEQRFLTGLMDFVMRSKDQAIMNSRIQAAVAQLPVRFTKDKFFTLVEKAMAPYAGATRAALEDQMYLLRTDSMALLPEDMETGYGELYEALEELKDIDFKEITEAAYWQNKERIVYISDNARDFNSAYLLLEGIVNDLYVMLLAKEYAMVELQEDELLTSVNLDILKKFSSSDLSPIEADTAGKLEQLEGRQEAYMEKYREQQIPIESLEDFGDPMTIRIYQVDLLLSSSAFVSLELPDQHLGQIVGEELLDAELKRFFAELRTVLDGLQKPVVRAVMAQVLSDLPVWFDGPDDMGEYFRNSLASCTDVKEKQTSIELVLKIMERWR